MVNPQTTLPAAPNGPISYTDVSGVKRSLQVRGRCFNCHATKTPTWRKGHSSSTSGKLLCNKCGLAETTQSRKRARRLRENNNFGCATQILGPDTMITGDRIFGCMPSIHPTAMTQTDESRVNKPRDASRFDPFDAQATPDQAIRPSINPFLSLGGEEIFSPGTGPVNTDEEVRNDGSDGLAGALSSNPFGVRSGQQFSQVGAGVFRLDAQTLATRYRTPAITYWDECVHHFVKDVLCGVWNADGSLRVEVMSAIREYRGNLYVTSVGTGTDLRLATIVHPGPASIQEVTKEFYEQTRDPSFGRTVYGHRRFIPGMALRSRWQSRFKVTQIS
ncbi:hypothetical protein B0H11DRAFT_1222197 [Mycena galericulata]|nr:hypothetical protein B0H11DRAFT_1222197 [Mycena galericulata]